MKILNYESIDPALWQGRIDTLPGERFFQSINCIDLLSSTFEHTDAKQAILGFCSDEGIRRNLGRLGARLGPNALRKQLAGLAYHQPENILDIGNILCTDEQLETAQQQFAKLISHCHEYSLKTIGLGGGHEIAWGHFQGLAPYYPKLGIINIDAHFDIRIPQPTLQSTSGTPFAQIKQYCENANRPFNYCCLGIQPFANTKSLFERAHEWNISYLTAEQLTVAPLSSHIELVNHFLFKNDAIYLSICLDAFAECYAPGVSAPQPLGLNPCFIMPLLKTITQSGKVVGIDIAELSPLLDEGDKTSRLAARLLAELL